MRHEIRKTCSDEGKIKDFRILKGKVKREDEKEGRNQKEKESEKESVGQ